MSEYLPEGRLLTDPENIHKISSPKLLREACEQEAVIEARAVMCDAGHNLTVDLGCMRGVIPREEGALGIRDGSVRDIAIISRVNRPVCFTQCSHARRRRKNVWKLTSRHSKKAMWLTRK